LALLRSPRYGEIADINLPRDKETGRPRGFAFLMYLDQRSTVLAVDNLNGSKVLGRTLRVDHTRNYEQPTGRDEDGEVVEPEEQSMNALPGMVGGPAARGGAIENGGGDDVDEEDPMAAYIRSERVSRQSSAGWTPTWPVRTAS
jgi:RNA-binding motif X-linked protein 2